jgi:hypothetical protein
MVAIPPLGVRVSQLSERYHVVATSNTVLSEYAHGGQVLVSSLKGEVKKKHNSNGWIFFLLRSPLDEQDLF